MPTPEALHAADDWVGDQDSEEYRRMLAEAFDRFAAQRGAATGLCDGGIDVEAISDDEPCPKCGAELVEDCAPPQTGGGDAPVDMSMEAVSARLATYRPLGSKARGVAGLAIAPGEPFEQDGADPTQTGGGDAGERARALILKFCRERYDISGEYAITTDHQAVLIPLIAAALRSSHREGAEAMRADAAMAVRSIQGMTTSKEIADVILALPIPGKTDAAHG